jgi:hypothetical protein
MGGVASNPSKRRKFKSFSVAHIDVININLESITDDNDFKSLESELQKPTEKPWKVATIHTSLHCTNESIYFIYIEICMDKTIDGRLNHLESILNKYVDLVLAGGGYYERTNPRVTETKNNQSYSKGDGIIWVTCGTEFEEKEPDERRNFIIRNHHGVFEITADSETLTGTFKQITCQNGSKTPIQLLNCNDDNLQSKILDEFKVSQEIEIETDRGKLYFGRTTISSDKGKVCYYDSCRNYLIHIIGVNESITITLVYGGLNNMYILASIEDTNKVLAQIETLRNFLNKRKTDLIIRLNLNYNYFIDSQTNKIYNYSKQGQEVVLNDVKLIRSKQPDGKGDQFELTNLPNKEKWAIKNDEHLTFKFIDKYFFSNKGDYGKKRHRRFK